MSAVIGLDFATVVEILAGHVAFLVVLVLRLRGLLPRAVD